MVEVYAYLCNGKACKECSYPECSHTTNPIYRRLTEEPTEMRFEGSINDVDYYTEYVVRKEYNND